METQENKNIDNEMWERWEQTRRRGKIAGGILVITAGILLLARESGADIPNWIFSWKTLLIALGFFIGIKHGFRHIGWLVLMLIGGSFLIEDLIPGLHFKAFIWPVLLILLGFAIIFKPRRKWHERHYYKWKKWQKHHGHDEWCYPRQSSAEDNIEIVTIFGSVKKNIVSKELKGGEVTTVFGGTELNLTQADFEGKITLEVNQVFGGTRLIIPSHWQIHSEMVTVFGGVEDKRPTVKDLSVTSDKILVLKGNAVMGGIEINCF